LGRLFSGGQNAVVVAIDHGQTFGPMPGLVDFAAAAERAIGAGARGVVFGRNIVQAQDPARLLKALKAVVKDGIRPAAALAESSLAV